MKQDLNQRLMYSLAFNSENFVLWHRRCKTVSNPACKTDRYTVRQR